MLWLLWLFQCMEYLISPKCNNTMGAIFITQHNNKKRCFQILDFSHTDNLEGAEEHTKYRQLKPNMETATILIWNSI